MQAIRAVRTGNTDKSVRPQDLNAILRNALGKAMERLQAAEVQNSLDPADNLPFVAVSAPEIEQGIISLLGNAEWALQDKPPAARFLSLNSASTVDMGRKFYVITVSDTGVGIPAAALPRIFEPFSRAEK